jgi:hypothetical protein
MRLVGRAEKGGGGRPPVAPLGDGGGETRACLLLRVGV